MPHTAAFISVKAVDGVNAREFSFGSKTGMAAVRPARPPVPQIADDFVHRASRQRWVESRCGAVSLGRTYLFPPLSSGGALVVRPWLRFHIPLIEPDVQISRIRLSDKTSRLHPRHVTSLRGQAYEPEVPVQVREWISPAPASPDLVLEAQPPAQPHSGVVIDRPIRLGDGAYLEVVRPSAQRAVQLLHQLCGLLPSPRSGS